MCEQNQLQELLNGELVFLPANSARQASSYTAYLLRKKGLSFETLVAVSAEMLDYRVLANMCWERMQARMSLASGADTHDALWYLTVFAVKFPQYFTFAEMQTLVYKILLNPVSPKNAEEEFCARTYSYLKNFLSIMSVYGPAEPDCFGYYTDRASAIRDTGVCGKLLNVALLFSKFVSKQEVHA